MRLTHYPIVLFLFFTQSLCAQGPNVGSMSTESLLDIANGELEGFAKEGGYRLLKEHSALSLPESNWIIPITLPSALIATASDGGAVAFITVTVAATFAGTSGATIVARALAGIASEQQHYMHRVYLINHYRSELHYVLEGDNEETIEGTCLYFYARDESEYTLNIEIDECSHEDIFPQKSVGTMRVEGWIGPVERYILDQDDVVVSKSIRLGPREL